MPFYFLTTNHLSDRELYVLLWEKWIGEPTDDIPPDEGIDTTTMIADYSANGMTHEEIFQKYYANGTDQKMGQCIDPGAAMPAHLKPPYDRDRLLPTPPGPPQGGGLPDDVSGKSEFDEFDDESEDLEEEPFSGEILPESKIEALMRTTEPDNWTPPAQKLAEAKTPLLPPDELTDETISPTLWELLHNLALRGFYVLHSDHLSDRELYSELWRHGLREPALLLGRNRDSGWFHDFPRQLGRGRNGALAPVLRHRRRSRRPRARLSRRHHSSEKTTTM